MDAGRARIKQAAYLPHGIVKTHLPHGLGPALIVGFFERQIELAGNIGPAQRKHAPQRIKALDGQNAGYHRRVNALPTQMAYQVFIFTRVKKELGKGKVRPYTQLVGSM